MSDLSQPKIFRLWRYVLRYEISEVETPYTKLDKCFQVLSWLIPLAVFLVLAIRQHRLVDHYAVNMMYWDQWDFYRPIFDGKSLWKVFTQQHGPHRQGAGFLITYILAKSSHWNSRWDAFGVSFTIMAASGLALALAKKCGVSLRLALIPVALAFFNIRQYESMVGPANLSHGAVPVLLLMLCSLAWFIRAPEVRLPLVGGLTFLLIFTGFGIFAGLVMPLVIAVEVVQAWRAGDRRRAAMGGVALLIVGVAWKLFAKGYVFASAAPNFHFPHERPLEYFYFMGIMLGNCFGIPGFQNTAISLGMVIVFALLAICLWHGWRVLRKGVTNEQASVVLFSLSLFVLIYCLNTAVGRVCMGLDAALASRYVTVMIPAGLVFLLHLRFMAVSKGWLLGVIYTALVAVGTLDLRAEEWTYVKQIHDGRKHWKRVYLWSNSELTANERSGFQVFPKPGEITKRLKYLKKHQLNLFDPATSEQ